MADGNPFQRRPGIAGFPRWRGVNKQGRPSSIAPNELRDAINIRFSGDDIINRGGQSKLSSNTVTGCVMGIFDNVSQWQGVKLYISGGAGLETYSPEDNPTIQTIQDSGVYYAGTNGAMASYDGVLHFAEENILYTYSAIPLLPDQDVSDVAGVSPGVKRLELGASVNITSMAVMPPTLDADDYLFLGTATGGIVYSWDGTSFRADSTNLGAGAQILATYHEDLYVFGTQYAEKRDGGSYTGITMPVATTSFIPYDATVYKDVLYIAGKDVSGGTHTPMILSYDGTTLAVARTLSSTGTQADAHEGCRSLVTAFGYLFYGWEERDAPTAYIGRFDGSTWSDTHKDVTAQLGAAVTNIFSLIERGGSLFAITGTPALIQSPGSSTSGTYTSLGSIMGGLASTTTDLFAF